MAGDLEYLASLNDQQFQATIKRLDQTIASEQAKMDAKAQRNMEDRSGPNRWRREFFGTERVAKAAFFGISASIGVATTAMRRFAEQNIDARRQLEHLDSFGSRVWGEIGLGASRLLGPEIGKTSFFINAWREFTNSLAVMKEVATGETRMQDVSKAMEKWRSLDAQQDEAQRFQQNAERRRSIEESVRQTERSAELEALRADHREREADAARVIYEYEQRIKQIKEADLYPLEKQGLTDRLINARDQELRSLEKRWSKATSVVGNIEQGQGLRLFSAVFGGENAVANVTEDKQRQIVMNGQRTNQLLQNIEQRIKESDSRARYN